MFNDGEELMTTKDLYELNIHPLMVPLDAISKQFLFEPSEESIRELYQFMSSSPITMKEIDSLLSKVQHIIDRNEFAELETHYLHLFELASPCKVKAHESVYYYGRIKPEYLYPLMTPLGIAFTPVNGKFADHFANQLLLLAVVSSQALFSSNEEEFRKYKQAVETLYKRHLDSHLQRIRDQIHNCQCNPDLHIYLDLITIAQRLAEEVYLIISQLDSLEDKNELLKTMANEANEL